MSSYDSYAVIKSMFVLGTTTSAIASGALLFTSFVNVPAFVSAPSDSSLANQWKIMFNLGKDAIVPLAIVAGGANLYNAYATHTQPQYVRFLAAGLISVAVMPYTLLAMGPPNLELMARADNEGSKGEGAESQKDKSTKDLFVEWGKLSAVRGFMFLASTAVAYDAFCHLTF